MWQKLFYIITFLKRGYSNTGKSIRMEPNNNRHFDSNHFRYLYSLRLWGLSALNEKLLFRTNLNLNKTAKIYKGNNIFDLFDRKCLEGFDTLNNFKKMKVYNIENKIVRI